MTWEEASFIVGILVLAVQFFQAYVTMGLKLWATDKFVAKDDMPVYLAPLKESVTAMLSEHRNR